MMEQEHSAEDARRFVLEEKGKHAAYLKYIKARGYAVDEEQLALFEEEIRVEAENLRESELIDEHAVSELQRQLAFVDLDSTPAGNNIKVLLLDLGCTKVRMRPDKNHQRPHFHIEFKRQYAAS